MLDGGPQYTLLPGQMLLTDQLIQRLRPKPLGQRGLWSYHNKI
jgi:hypothetical protein